ncbi:MAG: hypothetical protein EBU32_11650, partial [Opitutaceae bacterium]|nr:hypothetical protein [Opitutaceae bacterium]
MPATLQTLLSAGKPAFTFTAPGGRSEFAVAPRGGRSDASPLTQTSSALNAFRQRHQPGPLPFYGERPENTKNNTMTDPDTSGTSA